MTRTTRHRLLILATASVVTIGGISTAFYLRARQSEQQLLDARALGLESYRHGNYAEALGQLSKYIARNQGDQEALRAYARSRALTEEPDGRHITEGIALLRRFLDTTPDDADARRLLLDLYTRAGYSNEALQLSDRALATSPDDEMALRARYLALGRLRQLDKAIRAVDAYLDRSPLDLAAHWDKLDLLDASRAPAAAAVQHADALSARLGASDPRAMLIGALAQIYAQNGHEAVLRLRAASEAALSSAALSPGARPSSTSRPVPAFTLDADFVTRAADLFDRLGLYTEGQRIVQRAADSTTAAGNPDLTYTLVVRLWSSGRLEAVVQRTESLSPSDRASPSRLLAVRALALLQLGRRDQAEVIVNSLASREDDGIAVGWAIALRAAFLTPDAKPLARQKEYQAALARMSITPDRMPRAVLFHLLATVSRSLGENELAIARWRQSIALLPQWTIPYVLLTPALLEADLPADARLVASELFLRTPTVEHAALVADAWSRQLAAAPDRAEAERLVSFLREATTQAPGDTRLIAHTVVARLLAGQRDDAVAVLRRALENPATPPDVVARLSDLVATSALGLEAEVRAAVDQLPKGTASTTPDRALRIALHRHAIGQANAALQDLRAAATSSTTTRDSRPAFVWNNVLCRYLDQTNDPSSLDTLRELASAHPEQIEAHLTIVSSRAAWADRRLVSSSIEKLRSLTGDDAITWRVAQARLLLLGDEQGSMTDRASAEAVSLLSAVVASAPRLVAPRLLLAQALKSVNVASSVDQLSAAADLDPQSPGIAAVLTEMLINQGKLADARKAVDRVINSPRLTLGQRVRFSAFLDRLGDSAAAVELLSRVPERDTPSGTTGNDLPADALARDITLARLLSRDRSRWAEAQALFERVLAADPTPDVAVDAAELYARTGDLPRARETLDRALRGTPPDVGDAARATLEENHGDKSLAISLRRAIVARAASSPDRIARPSAAPHIQLATTLLRLGQYDEASRAIAAGTAVVPTDSSLVALAHVCDAIAVLRDRTDLRALVAFVGEDPLAPAVPVTLQALRDGGYSVADPITLAGLRKVLERHPRFLPAHAMLIEGLLASGRKREAGDAAGALFFGALPADPAAAQIAAAAYLAAGDPQATLGVASRWRQLTPENPVRADLFVASAYLALRDPEAALRQVRPLLSLKPAEGGDAARLTYCRALLAAGRVDEAYTLASQIWQRTPWARPALLNALTAPSDAPALPRAPDTLASDDSARAAAAPLLALLDRVAVELASTDADRLLLAKAWYQIGSRHNHSDAIGRAEVLVADLDRSGKASAPVRALWAQILDARGDLASAETQYRRALELDPSSAVISNNLADVLLRRVAGSGKVPVNPLEPSIAEAIRLARTAIGRDAGVAAFHDTLAKALVQSGDPAASLVAFRTSLRLAPDRPDTLVGYASALLAAGLPRDAVAVLRQIDALFPSPASVPPELRAPLEAIRDSARRASL